MRLQGVMAGIVMDLADKREARGGDCRPDPVRIDEGAIGHGPDPLDKRMAVGGLPLKVRRSRRAQGGAGGKDPREHTGAKGCREKACAARHAASLHAGRTQKAAPFASGLLSVETRQ